MRNRIQEWTELVSELDGGEFDDAIALRERQLADLVEPYDAFHLLSNLYFAQVPLDANAYVESEDEGLAAIPELAAALLIARPGRRGTGDADLPIGSDVLEPAQKLIRELLIVNSLIAQRQLSQEGMTIEDSVRLRARIHHLYMRGSAYVWQEEQTLIDLFGDETTEELVTTELGFGAATAVGLVHAVEGLVEERLTALREDFAPLLEPLLKGEVPAELAGMEAKLKNMPATSRPEWLAHAVIGFAWHDVGDRLRFSSSDLAEKAEVDERAAAAYLERLSVAFGQQEDDLFRRFEDVRARPFLRDDDGMFLCTYPGSDLWCLRRHFEKAVAACGDRAREGWQRRRAAHVEERAAELLAQALRPDEEHRDLELRSDSGNGQIDALLRCDDVLIVVEAKGATLGESAHRGGERLLRQLKDVVGKAADQSGQAREALLHDSGAVLLKAGKPIDLGTARIREVHPVVVTLDDLSVVAPVIWQLAGSRLLPDGVAIPWMVTLHELEVIVELVEYPAQLVHFLRRRSRLNQLGGRLATDELDWFSLYLHNGLYFEDEEHALVRYPSLTDAIDAYLFHKRGMRSKPAPKPTQGLPEATLDLLTLLEAERPPGHLAAACTLLDVNRDSQDKLFQELRRLRVRAAKRGLVQRLVLAFEGMPGRALITVVAVPASEGGDLPLYLRDHLEQQLEEHEVDRALALGVVAGRSTPIDALLVLEPGVWELPELTQGGDRSKR